MSKQNLKAAELTAILDEIARENGGRLHPAAVVEAARPRSHPLHSRFTWDDTEAARRYREWQARELIAVCVRVIPGHDAPVSAFVSLYADRDKGGYRTTVEVFGDAELSEQALADCLKDLEVLRQKYARFQALAQVLSQAIGSVQRRRRRAG